MSSTAYSSEIAAPVPAPPQAQVEQAPSEKKGSYGEILKSSALVGGSSVLNVGIGIIRTKAMAMLLGPGGFGLFGVYGSIANLTQSVAGIGINSSGVRQIAEAVGTGDQACIARTTAVLRRTAIVLGILGALLLIVFRNQIAQITFGSTERSAAVALLSLAVLFNLVSGGQTALIQGMRRIADLAKMSVLGAFFGVCTSVPLVYFFRQKGVVPSLISIAGMMIATSWWYSRKIDVAVPSISLLEIWQETSALLKLGSAFMASGFLTLGVAYVVRITVLRTLGLEATGLYQSAWTLGGFYVGIILTAMGADFYPRLTASIQRPQEANRLVNEQTLVGILLAGPGVLATLTFAPLVITLFYSSRFVAAVGVLRWICLGAMLQVISWPMGFIIVAKGKQTVFFFCELAWAIVAAGLAWICIRFYGVNGAGIAFFGSYVFHALLIYPVVHSLTNFEWSRESKIKGMIFLVLIGLVFAAFYLLPYLWAAAIGMLAAVASGLYSIRVMVRLVPPDDLPRPVRRLLALTNTYIPGLAG